MDCPECARPFSLQHRSPRALPCGHAYCLPCLQTKAFGGRCPADKKPFGVQPADLPVCAPLFQILSSRGEWCQRCDAAPLPACRAGGHALLDEADRMAASLRAQAARRAVGADECARLLAVRGTLNLVLSEQREEDSESAAAAAGGATEASEEATAYWRASVPLGGPRRDADLELLLRELLLQLHDTGLIARVEPPKPIRKCRVCGEKGTACSRCELDAYCGKQHQTEDWPRHKALCRPRAQASGTSNAASGSAPSSAHDPSKPKIIMNVSGVKGRKAVTPEMASLLEKARSSTVVKLLGVYPLHQTSAWTVPLLKAVALHVEELSVLTRAGLKHVKVIAGMTRLRSLKLEMEVLEDVDVPDLPLQLEELEIGMPNRRQMYCIRRMPRLIRLFLERPPAMEFPPLPPHHSGLRWLRVEPRSEGRSGCTLTSLLRAHAATLQEVQVMCGSKKYDDKEKKNTWRCKDDFFIPDLPGILGRCGLVALRRLVLCRTSSSSLGPYYCPAHDEPSCRAQVAAVLASLRVHAGDAVKVFCNACNINQFPEERAKLERWSQPAKARPDSSDSDEDDDDDWESYSDSE